MYEVKTKNLRCTPVQALIETRNTNLATEEPILLRYWIFRALQLATERVVVSVKNKFKERVKRHPHRCN